MVIMKKRYITWAEENGISTGYNQAVTKDRGEGNIERRKSRKLVPRDKALLHSAALCTECGQVFETKLANGRPNGRNRLLKPKYLPKWFPTIALQRALCGETFCHNKKGN